ncbi:MAG: ABC transporter ATP-binding protein [Bacteroidetes bacterium]|nr:ABC transporter ATP-binding protein [Bacteroidota bacterium]
MVEVKNIEKSFGKLTVLKGVNVHILKGKVIAILGPNGSGKTTLIKCILGLVLPDKGDILVGGENIKNNWTYRNNIGYLPQIARFPENLSVSELFRMIRDLRKNQNTCSNSEKCCSELVSLFQVQTFLNKPLRSLSGGTRQKVNVILALMFNSDLYIFDEPTVGLDPISCVRYKETILKEKQKGKTILLTTHILSEVEEMADEIIFLMEGQIYYQGSPKELMANKKAHTLEKAIAKMLEEHEQIHTC